MSVPIYITTQNRARLGDTVSELSDVVAAAAGNFDKSKFSMVVPELERAAALVKGDGGRKEVAIVGIESHVCVLMTVLGEGMTFWAEKKRLMMMVMVMV